MDQRERDLLIKKIEADVLKNSFPALCGTEPVAVRDMPAQRELRQMRRLRGYTSKAENELLPKEYEVVYQTPPTEDRPISQTVVIIADCARNPKLIIESK